MGLPVIVGYCEPFHVAQAGKGVALVRCLRKANLTRSSWRGEPGKLPTCLVGLGFDISWTPVATISSGTATTHWQNKRSLCTAVVGFLGGLLWQCGERRLSGTAVTAALRGARSWQSGREPTQPGTSNLAILFYRGLQVPLCTGMYYSSIRLRDLNSSVTFKSSCRSVSSAGLGTEITNLYSS